MISVPGSFSRSFQQQLDVPWSACAVSSPCLPELPRKMSAKRERDDDPEAVVHQRPDGVLARRAGAEVGPGDQDAAGGVRRLVEDERRVAAPGGEQPVLEAGAGRPA